jgi:hypothetical protein
MTSRTATALAWSCILAALGCIAAGVPLAKRGLVVGWPLAILGGTLIVAAIVLARLARKRHGES